MKYLVLLRHGQSQWNLENRFTGWADVPLTEKGESEARYAGRLLKERGFCFGAAHTSYLRRAIKTLWLALEEMELMFIPVQPTWRLNEKHYGTLQGLNKAETAAKYGDEQVKLWRRGFGVAPPALDPSDARHPSHDAKYNDLDAALIPSTESLSDTIQRIMPYWDANILPSMKKHDHVIVTAHGNSLRGIVRHLKNLTNEQILEFNIPTGVPYVFEFDDNLTLLKDYFLLDEDELQRRQAEVASQGKASK
ncbi:MAG: 2,3-diphosphoglycerate-dependent phosphoglycerate mutase [Flavobacteriales bacterium]|nr:2,3-diphosphoglycerate-dependent phosphoglycerate mutase [Flavobacteriales bacterium]